MKRFIFFIALLYCCSGWSQTQEKPIYYADVNGYVIPEAVFVAKRRGAKNQFNFISLSFENDTSYVFKLHPRKTLGILKSKDQEELLNYLDSLHNKTIDRSKNIIIHYHQGKDWCNKNPSVYRTYKHHKKQQRKLNKIFPNTTIWLYTNDEGLKPNHIKKYNWFYDNKELVKQLFFPYHYPCGSFVIISPNRNYIILFGEHGAGTVMDVAEEMIEHNK